ncbi:helix-turn-helix domain-containing protein, partial [Streptomyces sp. NPDC058953]|uniref:helix-turn-helix domain-containing protein n=1 Tax=Streptomyces sp. NPDC058953 TaxID=3346676 RepID=UPI003684628E
MGAVEGSAAGEFARRLRELRDGSGRSYGSLARRIGVSASTLHRYCSGATVPAEFAPVERLARLCGCTGHELIALHEAWVLADEERTRRQEAAATAPRVAAPEPPGTPGPAVAEEPAGTVVLGSGNRTGRGSRQPRAVRRAALAAGVVALAVGLVVTLVVYGNRPDGRPGAGAEPRERTYGGEQAGGPDGGPPTIRGPAPSVS